MDKVKVKECGCNEICTTCHCENGGKNKNKGEMMKNVIDVELVNWSVRSPIDMASHAALICYQDKVPEMGKKIDVEKRLFDVSHHTTLQHSYFSFVVDGIAVGDITFGMHLISPFYNSDQRSGRYCAKMFVEPDFAKIAKYIIRFWPEIEGYQTEQIIDYVRYGIGVYSENIEMAIEASKKFIKEERPFVSEKNLDANAPKIAQEQMRMFIPVIFPTAFDFTVNLTALVAMWESAWTPVMKYVTNEMVKRVVEKFPETIFMFNPDRRRKGEWYMQNPSQSDFYQLIDRPYLGEISLKGIIDFCRPTPQLMHPIDKLHFVPEMMDNSFNGIDANIEISVATMGQDQRHRTIRRSQPRFTGKFYMPPIVCQLELEDQAKTIIYKWQKLSLDIPGTLAMILAPYGAVVRYRKSGSFNAIAHEQGKRLCWCAQEEIYEIGRQMRMAIEKLVDGDSDILRIFEPYCYQTGKCAEGERYCGRDMNLRKSGNYFPRRKV